MGKLKGSDSRAGVEFDLTPMIDCVFQLLIFFMCTIKFKQLEGKLGAYLPKDVGVNVGQAEPLEKVDIVIAVVREGRKLELLSDAEWKGGDTRFRFSADRQVNYQIGPFKTEDLKQVEERLITVFRSRKSAGIVNKATIGPRKGVVNSEVVAVLDAAVQAFGMADPSADIDITFKGAE